jgi:hypothetical protein
MPARTKRTINLTQKIEIPADFIPGVFIGTSPEGRLRCVYYRELTGGGQDIGDMLGIVASDMLSDIQKRGAHNDRWMTMQKEDLIRELGRKLGLKRVEKDVTPPGLGDGIDA